MIKIYERIKDDKATMQWVERYQAEGELAVAVLNQSELDFWVVLGNKAVYMEHNRRMLLTGKELLDKIKNTGVICKNY